MPIEGLSDRDRLPRCGKIRLGMKTKNEKGIEYPTKTDYFILDPNDEGMSAEIVKVYGEKPKVLDIMFTSNDINEIFPQWLKRYAFKKLVCKGNGVVGTEFTIDKDGRTGEKDVHCEGCKFFKEKKCKPLASLMVILPKISFGGVWQLDTGSYNSIQNINAFIKLMLQPPLNRVAGIPLKLVLSPIVVTPKDTGKPKTVYILSLNTTATLEGLLQGNLALPETTTKALPEPDEADTELLYPETPETSDIPGTDDINEKTREDVVALVKKLGMKGDYVATQLMAKFGVEKFDDLEPPEKILFYKWLEGHTELKQEVKK